MHYFLETVSQCLLQTALAELAMGEAALSCALHWGWGRGWGGVSLKGTSLQCLGACSSCLWCFPMWNGCEGRKISLKDLLPSVLHLVPLKKRTMSTLRVNPLLVWGFRKIGHSLSEQWLIPVTADWFQLQLGSKQGASVVQTSCCACDCKCQVRTWRWDQRWSVHAVWHRSSPGQPQMGPPKTKHDPVLLRSFPPRKRTGVGVQRGKMQNQKLLSNLVWLKAAEPTLK